MNSQLVRPLLGIARVGVIYGGSIILLMIGELLLGRHLPSNGFGAYNLVRFLIPVVSALSLLGYDQALTREVASHGGRRPRFGRRQWVIGIVACGLGIGCGAYIVLRLAVPILGGVAVAVGASGLVVSSLVSSVLRASGRATGGAAAQQGYRFITGFVLIVAAAHLSAQSAALTLGISAAFVAIACLIWTLRDSGQWVITPDEHHLMRKLGVGYSVSMLALAVGDWLDQVMVAELADLSQVGHYGQAKLIMLYPLLSVGSVLGFVLLPTFASRRQILTRREVRRWFAGAGAGALILGIALAPATQRVVTILFGYTPSLGLSLALSIAGAFRLYYVLPSAILGASASPMILFRFGLLSLIGLAAQIIVTFALQGLGAPTSAAYGILTAISVRIGIAWKLSIKVLHADSHAELSERSSR